MNICSSANEHMLNAQWTYVHRLMNTCSQKNSYGLYVSIGGLHFFCKKFGGIEFYAYLCKINQKERYVWANKKRTKDEIIAALKATLARKKEWEKQAQEDFKRIRQERLNLSFNTYSQRDNYILKTVEVMDGNTANFAAIIVQKSNPRLNAILSEFDETVSMLQK